MIALVRYLGRRAIHVILVIAGVVTVTFIVTHLFGDPARLMLPFDSTQEQYLNLRRAIGQDDPILVQFSHFVREVATGNMGDSLWQHTPVSGLVLSRLPASLTLAFVAFVFSLLVSVPLGIFASLRPGGWVDQLCTVISLAGMAIADFWLGLMLIVFFAVELKWFPTSGYGTWRHMVLPALTLSARPLGRIAQMTRTTMMDELAKPYIRAVMAKGLSYGRTVFGHALKNALIGVVTVAGLELAEMIVGYVVVVETVFSWPGIGSLAVGSFAHHDLPLIQAVVLFSAFVIVFSNLVVDLLYAKLDPRIRYA